MINTARHTQVEQRVRALAESLRVRKVKADLDLVTAFPGLTASAGWSMRCVLVFCHQPKGAERLVFCTNGCRRLGEVTEPDAVADRIVEMLRGPGHERAA